MDTELHYAILKTMSYFQVFQYPVTAKETWKFLAVKARMSEVERNLELLCEMGLVFHVDQYYSLHNDITLVHRRVAGNELGRKKLKKAIRIARLLGLFPFVEAVCISGSLSKDFALKDSDLDFFVVTAPGRLWIARNFMHLFRKLTFVINAQDSFCMNYYISLTQPQIFPRNFYTAVEFSTLKAAYALDGFDDLVSANENWISVQLPNIDLQNNICCNLRKKRLVTQIAETAINTLGGDRIESWFYQATMRRWERKWSKVGYDIYKCMQSAGRHVNTPVNYPIHLPNQILQECEDIFIRVCHKYRAVQGVAQAIRA